MNKYGVCGIPEPVLETGLGIESWLNLQETNLPCISGQAINQMVGGSYDYRPHISKRKIVQRFKEARGY